MATEHANQWRLNAHAIDLAAELFWRAQSLRGEDAPYQSWRGMKDHATKQRYIELAAIALQTAASYDALATKPKPALVLVEPSEPASCLFCGRAPMDDRYTPYCSAVCDEDSRYS